MKLLLETEVAEILRCTPATVARIRKAGELTYLPGKPVLIDENDLNDYLENRKVKAAEKAAQDAVQQAAFDKEREEWKRQERLQKMLRPRRPRVPKVYARDHIGHCHSAKSDKESRRRRIAVPKLRGPKPRRR